MFWSLSLLGEKHLSLRRDELSTHRRRKSQRAKTKAISRESIPQQ